MVSLQDMAVMATGCDYKIKKIKLVAQILLAPLVN